MLDLIRQMKRTKEISMDRDKRTTREEPKVSALESIKGRWKTLRKSGRLCKEWQDFDVFYAWYDKQPLIGNRFYVITPDLRLPPDTICSPETAMILSKALFEYLSEYKIKVTDKYPLGVRQVRRGELVYLTYTQPGGSRDGGRYTDPYECQRDWLRARVKFIDRYREEHKNSPDVLEMLSHYERKLHQHIEQQLEYKTGNWRDQ